MNSTYRHSLAGSVILYNPDYDVPDNVASYLNAVDHLYVVDNQNGKAVAERIAALASEKVTVISNPENEGIAKLLNTVLRLCRDKYDLLITMDQDSRFFPGHMSLYRTRFDLLNWESIFGVGPTVVPKTAQYNAVDGARVHKTREGHWNSTFHMITSGNVIDVSKALLLGGFDESLFIDEVDHDMCYKADKAGFKLFTTPDILLAHQLGNPLARRFLWRTIYAMNHPPLRKYYIARNRLLVWRKFHTMNEAFFFRHYIYGSALDIFKILYMESDKARKIRASFCGFADAVSGRTGKRF